MVSTAQKMRKSILQGAPLARLREHAPWASHAAEGRGRLISEPVSPTRTDFQRDRDRLIHCDSFRRLKHKTQVFVHHEGDHYRTRLSHTIEVAQIARALARALNCDEDLAEALALVHDFGHTPFGHAGERALHGAMKDHGGFDHNAQSLRIVTQLERRYPAFDGLNLTWEVLEGLVKHNGPLTDRDGDGLDGPVPQPILDYNDTHDLWLWSWPSVEAQCAAIADDIAYDNHDLEDGLRAGLFDFDMLSQVPLCHSLMEGIRADHPTIEPGRFVHELVRRQITAMVEDVIAEAGARIETTTPQRADDVREQDYAILAFSPRMEEQEKHLKAFLFANMYRNEMVMTPVRKAEEVVTALFDGLMSGHGTMPEGAEWSLQSLDEAARARRIADYIAGMTDRYAIRRFEAMFDRPIDL